MRYLVSGKEMKLLDQNTSQVFHVPELVLMEQASMAFVQKLLLLKQNKLSTALIACGSGNNGGDGLAIARLLREQGIFVFVWLAGEEEGHRTSPSYDTQKQICSAYRIPVVQKEKVSAGEASYDVVIDALFGTGLSREISGELANDIDVLNQLSGWKVAVDIASGICSDDGAVLGTAFRADDTITFSFGKKGQYLWPGNEYCGKVHVVSMGITQESWLDHKPHTAVLEPEDLKKLPSRMAHTNKGSYGKLLIIAGSVNMSGAACFCAKAAYRMGSGLVRVFTCEQNRLILQTKVPEAVLVTGQENEEETLLAEQLQWADAVVFGPGIGTGQRARRMTSTVLAQCRVPLVLDADALNIIADQPELLEQAKTDIILTPHPGEMSRLTKKPVSEILTTLEFGLVFRTNAGAVPETELCEDIELVQKEYRALKKTGTHQNAGDLVYRNLPGYLARLKAENFEKTDLVLTDGQDLYQEICAYLPHLVEEKKVQLYRDDAVSLSTLYHLRGNMQELLSSKVWLDSGANIIIESLETLTVIDVNSGKNRSRREEALFAINVEAAKEIARQLRLRNISGMILVDFINLKKKEQQQKLISVIREELQKDSVPANFIDITRLGLVELTRKKVYKSLREILS